MKTFERDSPYKNLLVQATSKDLGCLDAIYVLLRFELIHQASAHVRLLCEGLITLSYIAQDPAARADQFLAYRNIEAYEIAAALLEFEKGRANPKSVAGVEAFRLELKSTYDQLKPKYTYIDGKRKQRPFRNWCNKSISDQARECGDNLVRLYRLAHRQMSAYVHGSPWSLRRQLAYSRAHYRADVVHNDVATVVRAAVVVWLEFAKFWDAQLGWNLTKAARVFAERVDDLDTKHFLTPQDNQATAPSSDVPKRKRLTKTSSNSEIRAGNPPKHPRRSRARENLETPESVFSSVEECIASMREVLPILRAAVESAQARGDKPKLAEAKRLVDFLEDTDKLREHLERSTRSDGSVRFTFTPEAWARFNEFRRTRK